MLNEVSDALEATRFISSSGIDPNAKSGRGNRWDTIEHYGEPVAEGRDRWGVLRAEWGTLKLHRYGNLQTLAPYIVLLRTHDDLR